MIGDAVALMVLRTTRAHLPPSISHGTNRILLVGTLMGRGPCIVRGSAGCGAYGGIQLNIVTEAHQRGGRLALPSATAEVESQITIMN
jgi:hypothetical protein